MDQNKFTEVITTTTMSQKKKKSSITPLIHTCIGNMEEHHHHDDVFDICSVFKDHLKVKISTDDNFDTCSTYSNNSCYRRQHVKHCAISIKNILTLVSYISPTCENTDSVIVFIPGNPGAIEFYDKFLEYLYMECQTPIFGVSHTGHDLITHIPLLVKKVNKELYPQIKSSENRTYTLEEQISHKIAFIQEYIKPNKKIILIAHSLGSYITLNMLKRMENTERISQVILLFPVFERTMETTSGQKWVPMTKILNKPVVKTTKFIENLPPTVKKTLIDFITTRRRPMSIESKSALTAGISSLVTANGLKNMVKLAQDLSKIGHHIYLKDVLTNFKDRLTFYYGASDAWTPLSFYTDFRRQFPTHDIRLDGEGITHAFVFQHSRIVASIVTEIIAEKMMENTSDTSSECSSESSILTFSFGRSKSYKLGKYTSS